MGEGTDRKDSLIVEVETDNPEKNPDSLDIPLPRLSRRYVREFKDLSALDPATFGNKRLPLKSFTEEETREIVFKKMLDSEIDHTIQLDSAGKADWRSVVGFFARQLLKELRLVGGYEFLYPNVRDFVRSHLFEGTAVDLDDPVVLRNLSEPAAGKLLFDTFKAAINSLTIRDEGTSRIEDRISLKHTRPFRTEARPFVSSGKSIFNRTVGEVHGGGLELDFARFLHDAKDCQAFAKNYLAVGFRLDYVKADGDLSTYTPDFIVRDTSGTVWIIETKGREELDIPQKMARLKQWCEDATAAEQEEGGMGIRYDFLYVDEDGFRKHEPKTLADLATSFTEYKV
jgi:type III restriction enzyme